MEHTDSGHPGGREAEGQLLQALDVLLDSSTAYIYIKNLERTFVAVSRSLAALAGKNPNEVVSMTEENLFSPETAKSLKNADEKVLDSKKPALSQVESIQDAGGNTRNVLSSRIPLFDESGGIKGLVCIMDDITELERMELLLQETEHRYMSLFDTDLVGLFRTSISDGTVIKANRAAARIVNFDSPEKLVNAKVKVSDFYSPERRAQLVKELSEHGMVSNFDAHYTLPDGTEKDILISAKIYPEEGYLEGAVIDITEKKQLEEQLLQSEKMRAIGALAGGIAHDLNNQLTGIMGCAQLMSIAAKENKEIDELSQTIITAVHHSAKLMEQLLAFARHGKYQSIALDMHAVVNDAIALLAHSMEKKFTLTCRLQAHHPWITGDPNQLEDVVINLVLNARDAMPSGGEIQIDTLNIEADEAFCKKSAFEIMEGSYVCLSVSDSGTGIEKKVQERIFEPFFTTKELGKGSGLGLASVYGSVKSHRGAIEVSSQIGRGTTFKVYLPVSATLPEQKQDQKTHGMAGGRGSILLVDDEEVVRTVMQRALGQLGYSVQAFASGREAVKFFRTAWATVDLIILDMVMPGLDGFETFMALHEINPQLKALFCSGFTVHQKARDLISRGAVGFVSKPFDYAELASIINRLLSG